MRSKIDFHEFIENTNNAKNVEELFVLLESELARLGYDLFVYSLLTDHLAIGKQAGHGELGNYPEGWFQCYMEKDYLHIDPVVRYVGQYRSPVYWKDLKKNHHLTTAEKKVLNEGGEAGLLDGIGIPIHGPCGELAGLGVASSTGGVLTDKNQLSLLAAIAQQFHLTYCELQKNSGQLKPFPSLTKREREVLKWCATGKCNWDIAKILSISEHGVEFHLRNIFKKLEVNSRVSAVVSGIRFGLIDEI